MRHRLFKLSAINIAANLTVPLAALVDAGMLGHLPSLAPLGGVALATIIFDYIYWSFGFLRMGTTGLTAQAVGAGDSAESWRILLRSLSLALLLGGTILLFQGFIETVGLRMLSGSPEVEAAASDYFRARVWAAPATLANFTLIGWFLGRAESGRVLAMTLLATISNVLLNFWFILHLGMGAQGAGLATMISQYLMVTLAIIFLWSSHWPKNLEVFQRGSEGFHRLVRLNSNLLIRTFLLLTCLAIFTDFSARMSEEILAANTILLRLFYVVVYLVDGVAFAVESLAGQLAGAEDTSALQRLLRESIALTLVLVVASLGILLGFPYAFYTLLTSHPPLIEMVKTYDIWLVPVLLLGGVAFILDGFFLGLTAGGDLRSTMFLAAVLGFVPLAFLSLHLHNVHFLWLAMTTLMGIRVWTLGRRLPKRLRDIA